MNILLIMCWNQPKILNKRNLSTSVSKKRTITQSSRIQDIHWVSVDKIITCRIQSLKSVSILYFERTKKEKRKSKFGTVSVISFKNNCEWSTRSFYIGSSPSSARLNLLAWTDCIGEFIKFFLFCRICFEGTGWKALGVLYIYSTYSIALHSDSHWLSLVSHRNQSYNHRFQMLSLFVVCGKKADVYNTALL